jgi:hypothetical protein
VYCHYYVLLRVTVVDGAEGPASVDLSILQALTISVGRNL